MTTIPPPDPVCAFHGKRWSEHEGGRCLYCPICFRSDAGYPQYVDAEGQMWDVCRECGAASLFLDTPEAELERVDDPLAEERQRLLHWRRVAIWLCVLNVACAVANLTLIFLR